MVNNTRINSDILSRTIGFDLVGTTPMTDDEMKSFVKKQNEEQLKWDAEHPVEAYETKKLDSKLNSKKPYILAPWEKILVKEILKITDDKVFDKYETYIYDDGDICLRTPKSSWFALAGREWCVNLRKKTYYLISMN